MAVSDGHAYRGTCLQLQLIEKRWRDRQHDSVATQASAVPGALVNGSGQLTGATGVTVGTLTYNVSFVDGSCNSLFGGCVDANFDFHTVADAVDASQALFTQIVSGFGNHPDKIFGCGDATACFIETPGTMVVNPTTAAVDVVVGLVLLFPSFAFNGNTSFAHEAARNLSTENQNVLADWTIATPTVGNGVPEPGSLALLGLGIAALGWSRRRAARTAEAMNSGAIDA